MRKLRLLSVLIVLFFVSCDNLSLKSSSKSEEESDTISFTLEPVAQVRLAEDATDLEIDNAIKALRSSVSPGSSSSTIGSIGVGQKAVTLTVKTGTSKKDGTDDPSSAFFVANYTYTNVQKAIGTYTVQYVLNNANKGDLDKGHTDVFYYLYDPRVQVGTKVLCDSLASAYVLNKSNDRWYCISVKSIETNVDNTQRENLFTYNANVQTDSGASATSATIAASNQSRIFFDTWSEKFYSYNTSGYFTIAVLPDTQYYTEEPDGLRTSGTYYQQAMDIVDKRSYMNTKFVLHTGDMTDDSSISQWQIASYAHSVFDSNSLPYCATKGNHDDHDELNTYFGYTRFKPYSWYAGAIKLDGEYHNDNGGFYTFTANNQEYLVVSIAPNCSNDKIDLISTAVEENVNKVIRENSTKKVILLSHVFVDSDAVSDYFIEEGDNKGKDFTADLWNRIIAPNPNIFMVVCGHFTNGDRVNTTRIRSDGSKVIVAIIDYQGEATDGKGGRGWYKVFTFLPAQKMILMTPINVSSYRNFIGAFPGNTDSSINGHTYEVAWDF